MHSEDDDCSSSSDSELLVVVGGGVAASSTRIMAAVHSSVRDRSSWELSSSSSEEGRTNAGRGRTTNLGRPQLTATGTNARDPIELNDDDSDDHEYSDDDENSDVQELSLRDRVQQRMQAMQATAVAATARPSRDSAVSPQHTVGSGTREPSVGGACTNNAPPGMSHSNPPVAAAAAEFGTWRNSGTVASRVPLSTATNASTRRPYYYDATTKGAGTTTTTNTLWECDEESDASASNDDHNDGTITTTTTRPRPAMAPGAVRSTATRNHRTNSSSSSDSDSEDDGVKASSTAVRVGGTQSHDPILTRPRDDGTARKVAAPAVKHTSTSVPATTDVITLLDSDSDSSHSVEGGWQSRKDAVGHAAARRTDNGMGTAKLSTDHDKDDDRSTASSSSSTSSESSTASSILRDLRRKHLRPKGKGTTTSAARQAQRKAPPTASRKRSAPSAAATGVHPSMSQDTSASSSSRAATGSRKRVADPEALQQKERLRLEKEQARERQQQERQAAEDFRRLDKERKEAAREAKRAAQEAAKIQKQGAVARVRQQQGKHAGEEIAALLEPSLAQHAQLSVAEELREQGYAVADYASALGCKTIQWIRKNFLDGGATDAVTQLFACNKTGYVHLPTLAVVFDEPKEFLSLLDRDDDDDDFPALEQWLKSVEIGWRSAWGYPASTRPRIVLLLYRVNQELAKWMADFRAKRNGVNVMPPSTEEVQDAIAWLLVQFHVECVACSESKYLNLEVTKITRMLAVEPYQQAATDLDCISKLKRMCDDDAPLTEQATDIWLRQLQMLPGMSFEKARNLTRHYPTGRSLWLAYRSPHLTIDEKRLLVSELLGAHSRQFKLSEQLYRLFTTTNPDEVF